MNDYVEYKKECDKSADVQACLDAVTNQWLKDRNYWEYFITRVDPAIAVQQEMKKRFFWGKV